MSNGIRRAVVVLAAAGLLLATAGPAGAEVGSFGDARFDTAHPADIVRVSVAHGEQRVLVTVHHRDLRFEPENSPRRVRIGFDVGAPYRGPDFYVGEPYQADPVVQLRHARGWGNLRGHPVDGCSGERIEVSSRRDVTTLTVARSCLGDPDRLRVNVLVRTWPRQDERSDAAPERRRSGPWVAQRPGTS